MADKEISELTAADTLDGDELIHVDQGGNSRKVSLTNVVALSTGAMLKAVYDANDDGIIAVAQGGTNSATAAGARTNLGLGTMAVQNAATVAITGGTVTGITDLTVADGGTGASDAATARTNLGLAYGVNVQAWNANLDGFAATTVTNVQNRVNHTGTQLAATISDFSTAADLRVAAAIGSTVQAWSANLDSWSALATASKLDASVIPAAEDGKILSWTGTSLVNKTAGQLGTFVIGADVQAWSANLTQLAASAEDGRTYLEVVKNITPEAGSFSDVYDAAVDAVSNGTALYLTETQRDTTNLDMPAGTVVHGPGTENVLFESMPHSVGADWDLRSRSSSLYQARLAEAYASTATPVKTATWARATGTSAGTGAAWEGVSFSEYQDGAGMIQAGALAALWPRRGKYKVEIRVEWETNVTGPRAVALAYNSSSWSSGIPQDDFPANDEVGFKTVTYSTFYVDVAQTSDFLSPLIYENSGSPLDYTMDVISTPIWVEPALSPGPRLLIFQGSWSDKVTEYGGLDGLVQHIAENYDTLISSNMLPYNDDFGIYPQTPNKIWYNCIGAWANSTGFTTGDRVHDAVGDRMVIATADHTSAGAGTFADDWTANPSYWREAVPGDLMQIQSAGWLLAQQFLRALKALRPDFEIFFYISGVIDVLYWDAGGNPIASEQPYTGGRGYANVLDQMERYDRLFPEGSGYFFDHFNPTFMSSIVRDADMSLVKGRGKKAAVNTLSIGTTSVNFAADCRVFGGGDALVFEGYYRDNGGDVEAATTAANTAIERIRARGVRVFAVCEEASEGAVTPGSANDLAARAIFDAAYVNGDEYQLGWTGYTTM